MRRYLILKFSTCFVWLHPVPSLVLVQCPHDACTMPARCLHGAFTQCPHDALHGALYGSRTVLSQRPHGARTVPARCFTRRPYGVPARFYPGVRTVLCTVLSRRSHGALHGALYGALTAPLHGFIPTPARCFRRRPCTVLSRRPHGALDGAPTRFYLTSTTTLTLPIT